IVFRHKSTPRTSDTNSLQGTEIEGFGRYSQWDKTAKSRFSHTAGTLDAAIADYTAAIRLNPNLADAYNNRGNAYTNKGELDSAIADYTAALTLDSELTEAYYNRGNAYYNKGDPDSVAADYRLSIKAAAGSGNMLDIFHQAWEFAGSIYENHPFPGDIPDGQAALIAGLAREALEASITRAEEARSGCPQGEMDKARERLLKPAAQRGITGETA
ncbi:MAG: tetratricopeptide repeat protein, partial [Treponema sp.]|nr:tetratricopeptide repeat protein [Treponema sp.]